MSETRKVIVNGEEFEDSSEEGGVLMLTSSVAKSIPEYNDNFGSYESEIPDFCLE